MGGLELQAAKADARPKDVNDKRMKAGYGAVPEMGRTRPFSLPPEVGGPVDRATDLASTERSARCNFTRVVMWNEEERAVLRSIGASLRSRGWAHFVTVERLIANWQGMAREAGQYENEVDDYTNDLTSRDGLAIVLSECPSPLRERLQALIDEADDFFRQGTVEDPDGRLGRYFRIDDRSGWWWKRRPRAGPLADYLLAEKTP